MNLIESRVASDEQPKAYKFDSELSYRDRYINFLNQRHDHIVWYFNALMVITVALAVYFLFTVGDYIH